MLPVEMGFLFVRLFRFSRQKDPFRSGRQSVRGADSVYNVKEVPLDARENHSEMQ